MPFEMTREQFDCQKRLSAGNPGDTISPAEMKEVIGMECDRSETIGFKIVYRAIRATERREVFWRWDRDRKVWHCLFDREKPDDLRSRSNKVRRMARRNRRVASSVDMSQLTDDQKSQVAVSFVVAGCIEILASQRTMKKLSGQVTEAFLPEENVLLEVCRQRIK
jgi:hypothetical protein